MSTNQQYLDMMKYVDHTLLLPDAGEKEFRKLCLEAVKYRPASVCVPPSWVKYCFDKLKLRSGVCTVVGFPYGYNTLDVKKAETKQALKSGANEIDLVINISAAKSGDYGKIIQELTQIGKICYEYDAIFKVIIECAALTQAEMKDLCHIVDVSPAHFIKTSTGTHPNGGATPENVKFLVEHTPSKEVKAAGGIKSFSDAQQFLNLGATRLGTSRLIAILEGSQGGEY